MKKIVFLLIVAIGLNAGESYKTLVTVCVAKKEFGHIGTKDKLSCDGDIITTDNQINIRKSIHELYQDGWKYVGSFNMTQLIFEKHE